MDIIITWNPIQHEYFVLQGLDKNIDHLVMLWPWPLSGAEIHSKGNRPRSWILVVQRFHLSLQLQGTSARTIIVKLYRWWPQSCHLITFGGLTMSRNNDRLRWGRNFWGAMVALIRADYHRCDRHAHDEPPCYQNGLISGCPYLPEDFKKISSCAGFIDSSFVIGFAWWK